MLRKKIFYGIILLYGSIFIVLYNQYETLAVFLMLCLLPVVLFGVLAFISYHVQVSFIEHMVVACKGGSGQIGLILENTSIFPIANGKIKLSFINGFTGEKEIEYVPIYMDAKSQQEINLHMNYVHCGRIRIECERIILYDYLCIFSWKKKIKQQAYVTITPDFQEKEIQILFAQGESLAESDKFSDIKSGDDPSEVYGIRSYIPGDKLQRIHWKLTYKRMEYMVKEYSLPLSCSTILLLDLYCEKKGKEDIYSYMDDLLERIISISYTLVLQNHLHFIAWWDHKLQLIRRVVIESEENMYSFIEEILGMVVYQDKDIFSRMYIEQFWQDRLENVFYFGIGDSSYLEENGLCLGVLEDEEC